MGRGTSSKLKYVGSSNDLDYVDGVNKQDDGRIKPNSQAE
jgi:hypothetical protein